MLRRNISFLLKLCLNMEILKVHQENENCSGKCDLLPLSSNTGLKFNLSAPFASSKCNSKRVKRYSTK